MRKLLLVLLLICPCLSRAQDSSRVDSPSRFIILKYSPLSILDPISSYQFAVEYRLWEKAISLQHEAGYITNILFRESDSRNREGIRLRNEIRFYLQPGGKEGEGAYIAPEILFIHYSYRKTGTICHGFDQEFFDCNYREKVDYEVQKQVYAFHPKVGYQRIYKGIAIDLYAGLGFRQVRIKETGRPEEFEEDEYFSFKKGPGIYNLPGISFGLKTGYKF